MGCSASTPRVPSTSSVASTDSQSPPTAARVPGGLRALRNNSSSQQQQHQQQQPQRRLRLPRPYHNNDSNPTHALWTPASLARERRIFFETRVSGAPEVWQAVGLAVEMIRGPARDAPGAQGILEAAGVSVPRGRLDDGAWDERGVLYSLPEWLLSDPVDMVRSGHEDEDGVDGIAEEDVDDNDEKEAFDAFADASPGEIIRIRARLSDRGTDVVLSLGKEQSILALTKAVREAAEIPSETKIKIAYLGRVLKDNQSLTKQGWQQGHVVNALVFA